MRLLWGTLRGLGVLMSFAFHVSCSLRRGAVGGFITFKVLDALVAAIVLASRRVVPFDAEPRTGRAGDLPDVTDRADNAVVGQSLADLGGGRHDGCVSAARGARGVSKEKRIRYDKDR